MWRGLVSVMRNEPLYSIEQCHLNYAPRNAGVSPRCKQVFREKIENPPPQKKIVDFVLNLNLAYFIIIKILFI
jgi:hypothetical protein